MDKPPAYYRARISGIIKRINEECGEPELRFLRNGYAPGMVIKDHKGFDNSPLTFLEITTFDTWFNIHPEKICGKTVATTSRSFPLEVKGSKEDVIKIIKSNLENNNSLDIKARLTKAKLKLLKLKF